MYQFARFVSVTALVTALAVTRAFGADTVQPAAAHSVVVFAAASLTETFNAIGADFEQGHPGVAIQFNFAGSQILVQQIGEGAPADVFASADEPNMQKAADAGEVAGPVRIFATNRLTIVVPTGNPKHITTLADLTKSGISLALAAPAVPAGRYAAQAFAKAGLPVPSASQEVDVRAVLNKVALDEADAGIVYATDIRAAAGKAGAVPIPEQYNVVARYPIAVLKHAADPKDAAAFADFVLSPAGRATLERLGFMAP